MSQNVTSEYKRPHHNKNVSHVNPKTIIFSVRGSEGRRQRTEKLAALRADWVHPPLPAFGHLLSAKGGKGKFLVPDPASV
jgi:hypothetical protein